MTPGEQIQSNRKRLGLSQEELGQQLFVSRQTISLWEKDQTSPTIDNLIRLREVFGISIDEVLGVEDKKTADEEKNPIEKYTFNYSENDLKELWKSTVSIYIKRILIVIIISVAVLFCSLFIFYEIGCGSFTVGAAMAVLIMYTISVFNLKKQWKGERIRLINTTYEYDVFSDYLFVRLLKNGETVRTYKFYLKDIEKTQRTDSLLILTFSGQTFSMKFSDLSEDSLLYSYAFKNYGEKFMPFKLRMWSMTSLLASLFSPIVAAIISFIISFGTDEFFLDYMWVSFFFLPITVATAVFGFKLKIKGYGYRRHIAFGIGFSVLLLIYGLMAI